MAVQPNFGWRPERTQRQVALDIHIRPLDYIIGSCVPRDFVSKVKVASCGLHKLYKGCRGANFVFVIFVYPFFFTISFFVSADKVLVLTFELRSMTQVGCTLNLRWGLHTSNPGVVCSWVLTNTWGRWWVGFLIGNRTCAGPSHELLSPFDCCRVRAPG